MGTKVAQEPSAARQTGSNPDWDKRIAPTSRFTGINRSLPDDRNGNENRPKQGSPRAPFHAKISFIFSRTCFFSLFRRRFLIRKAITKSSRLRLSFEF
jgi:hypothetical protein